MKILKQGDCRELVCQKSMAALIHPRVLYNVGLSLFLEENRLSIGYLFKNLENDNKMFAITQDE